MSAGHCDSTTAKRRPIRPRLTKVSALMIVGSFFEPSANSSYETVVCRGGQDRCFSWSIWTQARCCVTRSAPPSYSRSAFRSLSIMRNSFSTRCEGTVCTRWCRRMGQSQGQEWCEERSSSRDLLAELLLLCAAHRRCRCCSRYCYRPLTFSGVSSSSGNLTMDPVIL